MTTTTKPCHECSQDIHARLERAEATARDAGKAVETLARKWVESEETCERVKAHLAENHAKVECHLCHPMMRERDAALARLAEVEAEVTQLRSGHTPTCPHGTHGSCPYCYGWCRDTVVAARQLLAAWDAVGHAPDCVCPACTARVALEKALAKP